MFDMLPRKQQFAAWKGPSPTIGLFIPVPPLDGWQRQRWWVTVLCCKMLVSAQEGQDLAHQQQMMPVEQEKYLAVCPRNSLGSGMLPGAAVTLQPAWPTLF